MGLFGDEGIIAENLMHEQYKVVKYNQIVSNMLILHNTLEMSNMIKQLKEEGYPVTPELLAGTAPYRTANINRFGDYRVTLNWDAPPFDVDMKILQ